jgi:shikimate dehydrogenase
MIDAQTRCLAIFGNPVGHSLSPQMHNRALEHLGLNLVYLAFEVEDAAAAANSIRELGLPGASVTVPHKEAIVAHLDEVDEISRAIGAVNTVVNREGRLLGYNTDWLGVIRALEQVVQLEGKRCLILGSGGAARAAVYGLLRAGGQVFLTNRSEARGRSLASEMNCGFVDWQGWEGLEVEVVLNATPVGMWPNRDQSVVPANWLRAGMVVMDMVYRPLRTKLLRDAEAAGCLAVNGLEMLLHQGVGQMEIWTGKSAPVGPMRRALVEALENETHQNH